MVSTGGVVDDGGLIAVGGEVEFDDLTFLCSVVVVLAAAPAVVAVGTAAGEVVEQTA